MATPINSSEPNAGPMSPMMVSRQGPGLGTDPNQFPPGAPRSFQGEQMGPSANVGIGPGANPGGGDQLSSLLSQALRIIIRDGFSMDHAMVVADFHDALKTVVGVDSEPQVSQTPGSQAPTP